MEQILFSLVVAFFVSLALTVISMLVYDGFIAFPKYLKHKKKDDYKTVMGRYVPYDWKDARDTLNQRTGPYLIRCEWEVNGKIYRKTIRTRDYIGAEATFYYIDDPKNAMPRKIEVHKLKLSHHVILLFVYFIIAFLFIFTKRS